MISKLVLNIEEGSNTKTFKINDHSEYNSSLPVTCATLEITPPGFAKIRVISVKAGFSIVLNASLLHILRVRNYKNLIDLPDGLYKIRYSIDPNDRLFVEYNYFRMAKLNEKYLKVLACVLSNRKEYKNQDYFEKKRDLIWFKEMMIGAKYLAEDCYDEDKAVEVYNEVHDNISKLLECGC